MNLRVRNNSNPLAVIDRDVEIVRLVSMGYTAQEIADDGDISRRTVEAAIEKLKFKYECVSLAHLVATFLRKKIIE